MKVQFGFFLLTAIILTGCSESENEVKAEKEQPVTAGDKIPNNAVLKFPIYHG